MAGFKNFGTAMDAYEAGQHRVYSWRKVPTQTTATGIWFDLSMSPGNPNPQYYAATPMSPKVLAQSTDGGIFHGAEVTGGVVTFSSVSGLLMTATLDIPTLSVVSFANSAGGLPTGIVAGTLYYTVRVSATTSRLATSLANAIAGTVIAYTDAGTGVHSVAVRNARDISQGTKYLSKLTAMTITTTAVPLPLVLCDYLMYYPFIDMSVTEAQPMLAGDSLTRYATGAGVQMMAVEVAAQIGGVSFFVTYTNSDGVAGRVSATVTCNTQVSTGTIITTAPATAGCAGPFIPLQQGDSGVRSIQSITFLTGDVGLITLVLVKPLASLSIYDVTAAVERDFLIDGLQAPAISDDAYLNFICMPSGTLASAPILGLAEFIWI